MNWDLVVCDKCGLVNDYRLEVKSNNQVCYCNGCDKFLGNKPKTDVDLKQIRMPNGKYKNEIIYLMTDLNYLRWYLENTNPKGNILKSIQFKLYGK